MVKRQRGCRKLFRGYVGEIEVRLYCFSRRTSLPAGRSR